MTAPPRKGARGGSNETGSNDDPQGPGDDGGFFPELLRRGLTMGFTGLFMTEEAVRRALGDSAPREFVEFIVEQSEKTRTEFVDRMGREFGRVLTALDPVEIGRRLLDGRTIEVTARVRLVPESGKKTAESQPPAENEENA